MSTADFERAAVRWFGRFYALPPATLAIVCFALTALCYGVLPPAAGIPIVVLVALLPWYEARLQRRVERRGAASDQPPPVGRPERPW